MSSAVIRPTSSRTPWWLWLNVLSLDAPLLAVLWQAALAHVHQVKLLSGCYWALGLAVWVVYLTERTLDGFGEPDPARASARQLFYRRFRHLFAWVIIPAVAGGLGYVALTEIPSGLMWRGLGLAFLVAMYLLHYPARPHRWLYWAGNMIAGPIGLFIIWMVPEHPYRYLWLIALATLLVMSFCRQFVAGFRMPPKEILCGYLFAVGCSLGVNFFTVDLQTSSFAGAETLLLAVLCAVNAIGIACYEKKRSLSDQDSDGIMEIWPDIVRVYPVLLLTLAGAAMMVLYQQPAGQMSWYIGAILLSTALLGVVHNWAGRLSPDMVRVLADMALVTPLLWLAVG